MQNLGIMDLSSFDYTLSRELIAQVPARRRDASRMLVVDRQKSSVSHSRFKYLPEFFKRGDLIILNNTKVIPARLIGKRRRTGGVVELLLIEKIDGKAWKCMIKGGKKLKKGTKILFKEGQLTGKVADPVMDGRGVIEFDCSGDFYSVLQELGDIPLPPYIKREPGESRDDAERYQTIFSKCPGSSAAPTAGLHFTEEVLNDLKSKGVHLAYVTLHVGPGTFVPVRTEKIEEHKMEPEYFEIPSETIEAIEKAGRDRSRVTGVGSTVLRCVESSYKNGRPMNGKSGHTDLYVYPGYNFNRVNSLVTNFHLPKSTLFILVCAFAGTELMKSAYKQAMEKRYRFYSYGDAMLIL